MSLSELVLLVLTVILVTVFTVKYSLPNFSQEITQPIVQMLPYPVATRTGGDDRYTMAPRPQRNWDNGPEIPVRGALDPIPTRGAPEAYQQMGVITGVDNKVLPLYGRRVAPRSDRFNYYTRTDTYNPVALPVLFNRKDCQDNLGCDEVMNGDDIRLGATGDVAKVTLYGFDGPRYVA
jgi:hypothetical protein